jgi:hypothetical protein
VSETKAVHFGYTCGECFQSPIREDRYTCTRRPDFNICAACETATVQPYPMTKIRFPESPPQSPLTPPRPRAPSAPNSAARVHHGVTCGGCNQTPITGPRYKCSVRHNYDLCATCEASEPQPYPMVKFYDPVQRPDRQRPITPEMDDLRLAEEPEIHSPHMKVARTQKSARLMRMILAIQENLQLNLSGQCEARSRCER